MPTGANLVINGGFETGDFTGWTVTDPEPGNPDIGVDQQPLDVNSGNFGVFAGNQTSTLSQSIATTAGHTYTVSFYLDVYQSAAINGGFTATFGGQTVTFLAEPGETDGFVQYTAIITATSANSLLQFSFTDPGGYFGLDDVSVTDNAACYVSGARILTERGEVAVESLAIGDRVVTLSGVAKPIRWIGHRKLDLTRHPRPELVRPVRIAAGALGEGLPTRDLCVSAEHALWFENALVPASALINGATIRQEAWSAVEYFHVELDAHDILLAEGVPAESYLDCGDRRVFDNARDGVAALHPDWTGRAASRPFASPLLAARLRTAFARIACEQGRAAEVYAFESAQRERMRATRTNVVRNPRAEGSSLGRLDAGGLGPTHWRLEAPDGVAIEVVGRGEDDGLPFIDLRFVGRVAAPGYCCVYPEFDAAPPARRGQDWTMSCHLRLVGGALDGVEGVNLYIDERGADGAYLTGKDYPQAMPWAGVLALQRLSATRRLSRFDVAATMAYVQIKVAADATIDTTLRFAGMQIEAGDYASDLILPPRGDLSAATRRGLQARSSPPAVRQVA